MRLLYPLLLLLISQLLPAQSYVDGGNTRHRFAQLTLGAEWAYFPSTGQTFALQPDGGLVSLDIPAVQVPRLSIGGTHFWGHAYFFVNFPLGSVGDLSIPDGEISFSPSVETGGRYYPWHIERGKVRPFVGTSFSLAD